MLKEWLRIGNKVKKLTTGEEFIIENIEIFPNRPSSTSVCINDTWFTMNEFLSYFEISS